MSTPAAVLSAAPERLRRAGLRWVLAVELGAALTLGSGPGCAAGQQNHENVAVNPCLGGQSLDTP